MAAPNLVNVATITGKVYFDALADTNLTSLVLNPASSGKVFKINTLMAANVDGTSAATVDVSIHPSTTTAVGSTVSSTGYSIASTITVPADATLVVISKDTSIYLEESQVLAIKSSAADDIHFVVSYEELS
jgi:CCR4-NOT transcriptional regulation complex NOT5 subunit